jgi:RNA polymerase-binding transcription factor DksA
MTVIKRDKYKKVLISSHQSETEHTNNSPNKTVFYYCKECGRTITAERSIPKRICGLCADSSLTPN